MSRDGKLTFTSPQDQSLEAYKEWISQLFQAITGRAEADEQDCLTEEEWIEHWKAFWGKADPS